MFLKLCVTLISCCVLLLSVQCLNVDLRSSSSAVPQMPNLVTSPRYIYGSDSTIYRSLQSVPVLHSQFHDDDGVEGRGKKGKFKIKKKYKKYLLPLLIAYKLKFFTLVPVIIAGLLLLTGSTGMAGFFFALFISVMTLKTSGKR
ncbi:hypothetical protein DMENIID0001_018880 [Sergentomyia squamirostris]